MAPLRCQLRSPLVWLLAALVAGCAAKPPPDSRPVLGRIVESGVLRIGMSGEQPPLNMTASSGELFGLDVALARVLARSMGVDARFVRRPFGELIRALERGEVDIVMSGMTITARRAQRVAFVGPYYTSGKSLLTRSAELAGVSAATDLDSPELRLVALRGSTSEDFVRSTAPRARLVLTDGLDEAVDRVIAGKADALVADRETCAFAVLRHPDAGLRAGSATFTLEPIGIAAPLNQPRLVNLIQTYLNALQESGALEKAQRFWLEDPSWIGKLR